MTPHQLSHLSSPLLPSLWSCCGVHVGVRWHGAERLTDQQEPEHFGGVITKPRPVQSECPRERLASAFLLLSPMRMLARVLEGCSILLPVS